MGTTRRILSYRQAAQTPRFSFLSLSSCKKMAQVNSVRADKNSGSIQKPLLHVFLHWSFCASYTTSNPLAQPQHKCILWMVSHLAQFPLAPFEWWLLPACFRRETSGSTQGLLNFRKKSYNNASFISDMPYSRSAVPLRSPLKESWSMFYPTCKNTIVIIIHCKTFAIQQAVHLACRSCLWTKKATCAYGLVWGIS